MSIAISSFTILQLQLQLHFQHAFYSLSHCRLPCEHLPRSPRIPGPQAVEGNEVESVSNGLLSDGYVAPGDGVVIANSTLTLDEDSVGRRGVAQPARDALKIIQAVLRESRKDNARVHEEHDLVPQECISSFNFVICHTAHKHQWDGAFGPDWGHWHQEFDIQVGGTVGYEIYYARSGWFKRQGDGGFLNWAYGGKVVGNSEGGSRIVFGRI
ncbi:hypothetical protein BD779DRAFT_1667990 [Infundibulicybe gibba]|nr:hypothetical protein BD779DRAFT_1667990 [Infundibulicybe gibba]